MKICYLDAFSGIGGDMLVGALADAGAIEQSLSKLKTAADSVAEGLRAAASAPLSSA